ncbi:MAG: PEP/pyruvate-binding domain-containing protein, partial [Bacilli bacterium]
MAEKQYVYHFKNAYGLGKEILGGKGAGLAEMTHIGLPIPQGFTVTTEACSSYYENGKELPKAVVNQVYKAIEDLEAETGKKFGGEKNPLLVSVRSGARVSMPGMMDTILNLGLNDVTVEVISKETGNPRFAYDSYRRFILMFTNIAKGYPRAAMDKMLDDLKKSKGYKLDTDITADELKALVVKFK